MTNYRSSYFDNRSAHVGERRGAPCRVEMIAGPSRRGRQCNEPSAVDILPESRPIPGCKQVSPWVVGVEGHRSGAGNGKPVAAPVIAEPGVGPNRGKAMVVVRRFSFHIQPTQLRICLRGSLNYPEFHSKSLEEGGSAKFNRRAGCLTKLVRPTTDSFSRRTLEKVQTTSSHHKCSHRS